MMVCRSDIEGLNRGVIILICFLMLGCGGSSGDDDDLPQEIQLSVALPDTFSVKSGDMFDITAIGHVNPYHSGIRLEYTWDRIIYEKSLQEFIDDRNGNVLQAILSGDSEYSFAEGQTINEIAPDLEPGGHIIYSVTISADGYSVDLGNLDDLTIPKASFTVNVVD